MSNKVTPQQLEQAWSRYATKVVAACVNYHSEMEKAVMKLKYDNAEDFPTFIKKTDEIIDKYKGIVTQAWEEYKKSTKED